MSYKNLKSLEKHIMDMCATEGFVNIPGTDLEPIKDHVTDEFLSRILTENHMPIAINIKTNKEDNTAQAFLNIRRSIEGPLSFGNLSYDQIMSLNMAFTKPLTKENPLTQVFPIPYLQIQAMPDDTPVFDITGKETEIGKVKNNILKNGELDVVSMGENTGEDNMDRVVVLTRYFSLPNE
jgi:hypothetical protein